MHNWLLFQTFNTDFQLFHPYTLCMQQVFTSIGLHVHTHVHVYILHIWFKIFCVIN